MYDGHPLSIRHSATTTFEIRVYAKKDIDLIKHDKRGGEMPSYMSAAEPKSVREAYSRVAVIDIDINMGIMNIYIGGGET
jgi:hypothetical protein